MTLSLVEEYDRPEQVDDAEVAALRKSIAGDGPWLPLAAPAVDQATATAAARQAVADLVDKQALDAVLAKVRGDGLRLTGPGGFLSELVKAVLERGLQAELTEHLGYGRHDPAGKGSGNSRNGAPPKTVQTEEEVVKAAGLGYFRLTIPDHLKPQNEEVDRFVAFVRDLLPGTWLHFHCRAGIGRTTTFMALYDMMRNGKALSLDDILQRQVAVGGKYLTASDADADENKAERAKFLQQFYDYAKSNQDGFKTSFSAWLAQGGK